MNQQFPMLPMMRPEPIPYAPTRRIPKRLSLVLGIATFAAGMLFATFAIGCAAHIYHYSTEAAKISTWCGTCYAEEIAPLGAPPETVIPIAVVSAGLAIAAMIQGIRFFIAGKYD